MNIRVGKLLGWLLLAAFTSLNTLATTYYVNVSNTVPASPFTSWTTAATNIQHAVDVSSDGDLVLVASGVYETGATYMAGSNRVVVSKAITLQSVDGPATTIIKGYQVPGTTNGSGAIRCVYLTNSAVLSGFTLTNGAASTGGGVYCPSANALIENCVIVNNAANSAGGGYQGTYKRCEIRENIALQSGSSGGGVSQCNLENCLITDNRAVSGGGVYAPLSVVNCTITGNSCSSSGAGIYALSGGPSRGTFLNTICFFNQLSTSSQYTNVYAPSPIAVSNCCAPEFSAYISSGCLTNWPGFYDAEHGDYRLQIGSPCINAGNNDFVNGATDVAGNARIFGGTVDMGAYENQFSGTAHFVSIRGTNSAVPYTNWVTAATNIQDAIDVANSDEPIIVSNGVYKTGGRVVYEALTNRVVLYKPVTVQSLNGPSVTVIEGYPAIGAFAVRCAYLTNGATLMGFTLTNGATANAGDAVKSRSGGGVWCESTNASVINCFIRANKCGFYCGGGAYSGTLSNCFIQDNALAQYGGGAADSCLIDCTVSNNSAISCGGGVVGGFLSGSIVTTNKSVFGGGACSNILVNTLLANNQATKYGGGAFACLLTNCTVSGNNADSGGGGSSNIFTGCVLANNVATNNGGGVFYGNLMNCTLSGNSASGYGGGSFYANLTDCVILQNHAGQGGGGVAHGFCGDCMIASNNATSGGGVISNTAVNCTIISNWSYGSYYSTLTRCRIIGNVFGGSYYDTLKNCILQFNQLGPGAYGSSLNNCTVVFNGAPKGDYAISDCYATNCIVYSNYLGNNYHFFPGGGMSYCCTTPLPSGPGNFTNAPLFLDSAYHLQTNSPCIDAGDSSSDVGATDLDGRPRIVGASVDVGAMEFQGADVEPFISWMYQYGLPNDGSADYVDSDGDVLNNWQEWKSGTIPTNSSSVLKLVSLTNSPSGMVVTWQSVTNITYYLERSSDLTGGFSSLVSNLVGQVGSTSYTDTTATNDVPYFYRVGVQ